MTRRYYANAAPQQQLAAQITAGATSLTVSGSFAGWPVSFPYFATLDIGTASAEVVSVTNVVGTTATIVRAQDGTAAISHAAGATFDMTVVRADFDEANAHVNASTGVHGVSGSVVGTSDVQTLTNKTLTTPTVNGAALSGTLSGDHTVSGAATFSKAGTALAVTNNATVGGTLGVSGALTAGGAGTGLAVTNNATIGGTLTLGGLLGGVVPAGVVLPYGGAAAPAGYLLCTGAAVSRVTYAALFAAIGTAYGAGDGATTFNIPNTTSRFPVSAAPGATGGAAGHVHALSASGWADVQLSGSGSFARQTPATGWNATAKVAGSGTGDTTALTSGAQLGGATDSGDSLPPWIGFNFIIKT